MSSFVITAGGIGAAVALAVAPSAAQARPAAGIRVIRVPCSSPALGAAITTANALGAATLRLAPDCVYSVTTPAVAATDALPIITGNVTLLGGPSTTIRRAPAAATAFRIVEVAAGGTLTIRGIALLGGSGPGAGGGAILDNGTLRLGFVTLSGNTAPNGGALSIGATATALITNTVFKANSTAGSGGALINLGRLTLLRSRVTANNAAVDGGGIDTVGGGTSTVARTTIDHNVATGDGGGVVNTGTTSLDRVLVERNRAVGAGGGGGVFNFPGGIVTIRRSIIRNNVPNNCVPLNGIQGCTS